jgi:predicted P-loop ATPase
MSALPVSDRRDRAQRFRDNIPRELQDAGRCFVVWIAKPKKSDPTKVDKVPYYPTTRRARGANGTPEDRASLGTFDEAVALFERARMYAGIGAASLPDLGFWFLDLDDVDDPARESATFVELVERSGTYYERSPSGRGIRAVFRGRLGFSAKNHAAGVEVFDGSAFVTLTGDTAVPGRAPVEVPPELRERILATTRGHERRASAPQSNDPTPLDVYVPPVGMTDDEIRAELRWLREHDYDNWREEGMAIHHETGGHPRGLALWLENSIGREGYDGPEALTKRWKGFGRKVVQPVTLRSLMARANRARATVGLAEPLRKHLRATKQGLIPDEENVRLILEHDPELQGVLRFDEFSGETILAAPIPDGTAVVSERGVPRPWQDSDTVALQTYIQRRILPRIGRDRVEAALTLHSRTRCAFHPVRDYLQGVKWDGVERVDTWLQVYLGAHGQPDEYLRAVGPKFLIAAAARILEPGCKADSALVLESPQGSGKSTAAKVLAGDAWFSDSLPADLAHKDARDHLRGKWIVELPELAQFRRAEIETIKAFLSRCVEQYRPAYGRREVHYPRQCVFIGTTNEQHYLVDTTGNRRFWVVKCGRIDLDALRRDRDALWAEATCRYYTGERWHLSAAEGALAASEADSRVMVDPWTAQVADVLDDSLVGDGRPDVTPGEVLQLMGLPTTERHGRNAARVAAILRELGWRQGQRHKTRGQVYLSPRVQG